MKNATKGFWKCVVGCTDICGSDCLYCLWDGPIFVADIATGGTALA